MPAPLGSVGLRPPAPQEGEPTRARCHLLRPLLGFRTFGLQGEPQETRDHGSFGSCIVLGALN